MSEQHRHTEVTDETTVERYRQAAGILGNVAVDVIGQPGDQYTSNSGHAGLRVPEGELRVQVAGPSGPSGMDAFHREVAKLEAEDQAERTLAASHQ